MVGKPVIPDPEMVDEDSPELDDAFFAKARPTAEVAPEFVAAVARGRGVAGGAQPRSKALVTLRLDRDVVERFRADGPGWQSRMNEALRKAAGL